MGKVNDKTSGSIGSSILSHFQWKKQGWYIPVKHRLASCVLGDVVLVPYINTFLLIPVFIVDVVLQYIPVHPINYICFVTKVM
jgi:hypothetical protein